MATDGDRKAAGGSAAFSFDPIGWHDPRRVFVRIRKHGEERMGDRCEPEGETVVGIRLENASLSVAEHLATSRGWPGQIPRSRIRNDRVASALFHAGGPGKDL